MLYGRRRHRQRRLSKRVGGATPGVAASANKSCDAHGAVARRERCRWRREGVHDSHVSAMEGPRRGQFLPDNLRSLCCCFGAFRDLCRLRGAKEPHYFWALVSAAMAKPPLPPMLASLDAGRQCVQARESRFGFRSQARLRCSAYWIA